MPYIFQKNMLSKMYYWFICITRVSHSTLGTVKCYVMVQAEGRHLYTEGITIKNG